NFSLISGTLLQVALVGAVSFTAMAYSSRGVLQAGTISLGAWIAITVAWKFIMALVPEDFAELTLRTIIPVSYLFYYLFWPVLFPLRWLLGKLSERRANGVEEEVTEEEVQAYIDVGEEEGIIEEGEGKLIQSIVDFGDRIARELMTPRVDMIAAEADTSVDALAKIFSESKYSRIPIYEEGIDNILGTIHLKDVFDAHLRGEPKTARALVRPAYFVTETKKVSELLREFQLEHLQMAIVLDEYGGTAGLISIEDVLEEIVGEIADEHEERDESILEVGDGVYLVNGLVRVETLAELMHADLRDEGYETVAGLIFTVIGRVPKVGEKVTKDGVAFEVERADRKRIYRVRVTRESEPMAAEE
ncbi:MAG TPA: hemolysin family protein, partial [Thermoanaerobaculia bacterium]